MKVPLRRNQSSTDSEPKPAGAGQPSIFEGVGPDDRASIERGLAQSSDGVYASEDEVEAAFALFDL